MLQVDKIKSKSVIKNTIIDQVIKELWLCYFGAWLVKIIIELYIFLKQWTFYQILEKNVMEFLKKIRGLVCHVTGMANRNPPFVWHLNTR